MKGWVSVDSGQIRNTQSQLKDVERLLKLDPGNADLLRQKQMLLGLEFESTKHKGSTCGFSLEGVPASCLTGESMRSC